MKINSPPNLGRSERGGSDEHHSAHLAVRRAHRHLHHAREHHGEGTGELDAEPALVVDIREFLSDCANHAVALYTKHAVVTLSSHT